MEVKMRIVQGRPHGKSLRFPPGEFVFGRGPECHVRPNSPWVSRQHCLLRIDPEAVVIRDLGSTNGTLVNGSRLVGERRLQPGDQLQVGPLVLQFVIEPPASEDALDDAPARGETDILSSDTGEIKCLDT